MSFQLMEQPRFVLATIIVLTLAAAVPRFFELDVLGFYGDEETTAFAARSVVEEGTAKMPSGMPYRRAQLFTWANAGAAHLFGVDREISYRLTAALFGTLTVPLLFVLARPFFGGPVALIAAILLAFSEWHIATSREARMYAPFLFFYIAAAFYAWRWSITGQLHRALLAGAFFLIAVSLHEIGIMSAMFALIAMAFAGWARVAPVRLVAASAAAAISAVGLIKLYVDAPYKTWFAERVTAPAGAGSVMDSATILGYVTAASPWIIVLTVLGAFLGCWAAARTPVADDSPARGLRTGLRYVCAMLAGAGGGAGQLFAAASGALLFLLLHPGDRVRLLRQAWAPVAIIALIAVGWSAIEISTNGLIVGAKNLSTYPFPYPAYLAQLSPGVFLLFAGSVLYFSWRPHRPEEYPVRGALVAAVVPLILIGMVSRWGGVRYLIEVYPFVIVVAAFGLFSVLATARRFAPRISEHWILVGAFVLAASGALGGHGIPQAAEIAMLRHGDSVNSLVYDTSFYPDHKTPGEYVRRQLKPGDIVIAEDPLEQRWYIGHIDYWFYDLPNIRRFLYRSRDDRLRDIYVSSVLLDEEALFRTLLQETTNRVWFITSGERQQKREFYLSVWQRRWLDSLEQSSRPAFEGRDGLTRVYCLNCTGNLAVPAAP